MEEELCLVDSGTTNSIVREIKYFHTLRKSKGNVMTITGHDAIVIGSGQAMVTLPRGTQITIDDALLYPDSTRTLLSYRDIRKNGFHVDTHEDNAEEFLLIIKCNRYGKQIIEKIPSLPFGLYYTYIEPVVYVAYKLFFFSNLDTFHIWHDRLDRPGVGMMRKSISNSNGHNLNLVEFPKSSDFVCTAYAMGKLILGPSYLKIQTEPPKFLEWEIFVAPLTHCLDHLGTLWFS